VPASVYRREMQIQASIDRVVYDPRDSIEWRELAAHCLTAIGGTRPGAVSRLIARSVTAEWGVSVNWSCADDCEFLISYNQPSKPRTNTMRRPSIVTGIAYVQLLTAVHILKAFASPYTNRIPLYIGSPLSVHTQWTYMASLLPVAAVVGVGLVLGKNWARWLLAAMVATTSVFTIPTQNAQGIYSYALSVLMGLTLLALLFFAPSARAYFGRPRDAKRSFSLRNLFAGAMFAFCAVNTSLILKDRFASKVELLTTSAVLAVLSFPALLLGIVTRWDITSAFRDAATVLLSTALFLACRFLLVTVYVHTSNPGTFPLVAPKDSVILTAVVALLGVLLARVSAHRLSRTPCAATES
jgi:hypothetical protein